MLAWALALHRDQYGRPISGLINFCDLALQFALDGSYINTVNTLLHELAHVLFLSEENFAHYNLANAPAGLTHDNLVRTDTNGHHWLMTPNAKEVAREFWGCPSAPGVPIENQGGDATKLKHFEERFMLTDAGTGISYNDKVYISEFFFAVAQDSGWYCTRIKSGSSHFRMGYKKGCRWITEACIDDADDTSNFPEFFCDGGGATQTYSGCTADGYSIAECGGTHDYLAGSGRIEGDVQLGADGYSFVAFDTGMPSINNRFPWYE